MTLATEIAAWYENHFKLTWGRYYTYAVVQVPPASPYFPMQVNQATSREAALGLMRMATRPDVSGWFLAVIGPWGVEGTRA